jgi:hypothetical protein
MSSEIKADLIKDKSGTKTLATLSSSAVTLHSDVAFPSGHVIKVSSVALSGDAATTGSTQIPIFNVNYTPNGGPNNTSTVYAYMHAQVKYDFGSHLSTLGNLKYNISGDDITNVVNAINGEYLGKYRTGNSAAWWDHSIFTMMLQPVTLDGTGNANINYLIEIGEATTNSTITFFGNNTLTETHIQFWEVV